MAEGEELLTQLQGMQAQQPGGAHAFVDQSEDNRKLADKIQRDCAKAAPRVATFKGEGSMAEMAYDGHQWDEMDRMRLEQLRRPTITFNEIKPTINAISGIERMNRPDIRFVTRPLDSQYEQDLMGDLATESYATVLDLCDGDMERSRAIRTMTITGMGWYEIHMDYETEPDGKIVLTHLPWREMLWDTAAKRENIQDSRWRARKREVGREEFKRRWGAEVLSKVDVGTPQYEEMNINKYELVVPYYSRENEKANPQVGEQAATRNTVPVVQYQWMTSEVVYRFEDPQAPGGINELREAEFKRLKERLGILGLPVPEAAKQHRAVYREAYEARGYIISEPTELVGGFSLKCITGEWDEQKKVWYGVVRPLLDPQKTMNKSMSTALTMFLTNAKGGVMFETGAFMDPEMAKNQWSRADAWIELAEGGAERIVQRQPVNHQGAVDLFFSESKAAMNYVSGIPAEMTAVAQGEVTAPTIMKRTQAAMAVLGWFFDNITRARKEEARTVLEYIRNYWSFGQLIKVGGQTQAQAVPLLKANLPLDYDLVLDDSVRHNPNLKAQIWQDIQPMIPAMLKFGLGPFILKLLKFTPLPAQLVNEMQQFAQQQQQQNQGQQAKGRGKQDPPEIVQGKAQQLQAQTQKILAEARKIDQESGFKVAEMALDAQYKHAQIEAKQDMIKHRHFSDMLKGVHMLMGTARNRVG